MYFQAIEDQLLKWTEANAGLAAKCSALEVKIAAHENELRQEREALTSISQLNAPCEPIEAPLPTLTLHGLSVSRECFEAAESARERAERALSAAEQDLLQVSVKLASDLEASGTYRKETEALVAELRARAGEQERRFVAQLDGVEAVRVYLACRYVLLHISMFTVVCVAAGLASSSGLCSRSVLRAPCCAYA